MTDLELAVKHFEEQKFDDAILIYGRLISSSPDDAWLHHAIGLCFTQLNRQEEALASLDTAIRLSPNEGIFFYHIGLVFERTSEVELAIKAYERSLELNNTLVVAWNSLAQLYIVNNELDKAKTAYENLLVHHPQNHQARHMVLSLSKSDVSIASKEYIEDYFDSAASYFDEHLQDNLNYKLPSQIASLSKEHLNDKSKVLDLGCGTGLVAQNLKDLKCNIVGVDLSSKMLEVSKEKNIYSSLHQEDVLGFLKNSQTNSYDMVSSADVFIYIGDLSEIFKEVSRILKNDGIFLFSTENSNEEFCLQKNGRFGQSASYIKDLSKKNHLKVTLEEGIIIRKDGDKNENGTLWYLSKKKL